VSDPQAPRPTFELAESSRPSGSECIDRLIEAHICPLPHAYTVAAIDQDGIHVRRFTTKGHRYCAASDGIWAVLWHKLPGGSGWGSLDSYVWTATNEIQSVRRQGMERARQRTRLHEAARTLAEGADR